MLFKIVAFKGQQQKQYRIAKTHFRDLSKALISLYPPKTIIEQRVELSGKAKGLQMAWQRRFCPRN